MAGLPEYELFALRYAWRDARRRDHFIMGDPHDAPMPMDYFVWAARSPERVVVIDTGFTEPVARKRKRIWLRDPVDSLRLLGIDPDAVEDVILTHLHYDHAGNFMKYRRARFHLQETEIQFCVGRHMRFPMIAHAFEVEDITGVVKLNFDQRMHLYTGPMEIAPGIVAIASGGHTPGFQFVRIHTRRGWVAVASDATHFYENLESGRPFPAATNIPDLLEGYDRVRAAADSPQHIVPGHDPEVMKRYPAVSKELEGIAVRLDLPPSR